MKKKIVAVLLVLSMMTASACGKTDTQANANCQNGCTCENCPCCNSAQSESEIAQTEAADILAAASTEETVTETAPTQQQTTTEQTTEPTTESHTTQETQTTVQESAPKLTEGEKKALRQQQAEFAKAREGLYGLTNSLDKTDKINQMDRQIIANNSYDFSDKNIIFIGDSITEGVTGGIDQNGNLVSYVNYTNSNLHFQNVINQGKAGRMFADYGGEEYSLSLDFGNVTNVDADIIVVFAGVNDYLAGSQNKRYGDINDTVSTAGYCGSVRYFMKQLQMYYSDREVFFVTMYNINKKPNCIYSDLKGKANPTLADYMDVEKKLAKEYGFHVIDLYSTGFMDCSTKEASDYYLRDGLHPKDNGNIVLGEHIAAELSLYFSQKQ